MAKGLLASLSVHIAERIRCDIRRHAKLHAVPADAKNAVQRVEDLMIGPKQTQIPDFPEKRVALIY